MIGYEGDENVFSPWSKCNDSIRTPYFQLYPLVVRIDWLWLTNGGDENMFPPPWSKYNHSYRTPHFQLYPLVVRVDRFWPVSLLFRSTSCWCVSRSNTWRWPSLGERALGRGPTSTTRARPSWSTRSWTELPLRVSRGIENHHYNPVLLQQIYVLLREKSVMFFTPRGA